MKLFLALERSYQRHEKTWNRILLILGFAVLFFAVQTKPYYDDDLVYCLKWNSTQPLSGIKDIVEYQMHMYQEWGGRTVAHSILQLLFLMGKPFSAGVITLVFFLTAWMVCRSAGTNSMSVYFLVVSALYYLNPAFAETVLWYTGTANYLFTIFLVLCAVQPFFRMLNGKPSKNTDWLLLPVAFLAGWTNENIAPTMILFMAAVLFFAYRRNRHVSVSAVCLLLASAAGCCFLLLAPGNFVRAGTFTSGWMSIAYRGYGQINAWMNWLLPLMVCYIVLRYRLHQQGIPYSRCERWIACWGFASILVMILSPSYPSRATFGSLVLLLIPMAGMTAKLAERDSRLIRCISVLAMAAFCGTIFSVGLLQYVRNLGTYIPG